ETTDIHLLKYNVLTNLSYSYELFRPALFFPDKRDSRLAPKSPELQKRLFFFWVTGPATSAFCLSYDRNWGQAGNAHRLRNKECLTKKLSPRDPPTRSIVRRVNASLPRLFCQAERRPTHTLQTAAGARQTTPKVHHTHFLFGTREEKVKKKKDRT
ncbi:unnamed protein product, partial [Ectocarpus sp. 6 AP-2014]